MAAEIRPPELARLLDYAERPRTADWSLRAALTRYAQGQPQRVGDLLELVRRVELALRPHLKAVAADGPAWWDALQAVGTDRASGERARADAVGARPDDPADPVLELLSCMVELDRAGDALAAWAAQPRGDRPDAVVDEVTTDVAARLERLGVPREERPRASRARG